MKFFKKLVTCLLAGCMLFSVTACNVGNTDGREYTGKETELKVGVYDGGLGHVWLEKVAAAFEEKFQDTSFEEGKTGVRIKLNPTKSNMLLDKVEAAIDMNQSAEDVYFLCQFTGTPEIFNGRSLNITDMVKQKVYLENGELADMEYDAATGKLKLKDGATAPTKSIADKMTPANREGYYMGAKQLDRNGDGVSDYAEGYWALPFENSLSGLIYDHDLFEEEGWLDYDGIDGLPDTMDDFFDLCDRIVDAGMIPFIFSRNVVNYWGGLADAFLAQYEGYGNAELDYTFNGSYTFPAGTFDAQTVADEGITVNADNTQTVEITRDNAWMLIHTPGKAAWIRFLRQLVDPKYYDDHMYDSSFAYTDAPKNFILSKMGKAGQKRIAMLYEGEWWENENRAQFAYAGGYGTRDFRFFPLPYIEGQKNPDMRSVADYSCGVDLFVNAKTQKAALAKIFLQYVHSESALETFTIETGITRMYDYDLSDEQLAKVSKFGQNTYKIKMTDTTGVTVTGSRAKLVADPFWSEFRSGMGYGGLLTSDVMGDGTTWDFYQQPVLFFADNAGVNGSSKVSADSFLAGMYRFYDKTNWTNALNNWKALQNG